MPRVAFHMPPCERICGHAQRVLASRPKVRGVRRRLLTYTLGRSLFVVAMRPSGAPIRGPPHSRRPLRRRSYAMPPRPQPTIHSTIHNSVLEAERDDYCGGQSVVACAALSIAQLAISWRDDISHSSQHGPRTYGGSGGAGFDIAAMTDSLSQLLGAATAVGANGGAANHSRLRTTIADYSI